MAYMDYDFNALGDAPDTPKKPQFEDGFYHVQIVDGIIKGPSEKGSTGVMLTYANLENPTMRINDYFMIKHTLVNSPDPEEAKMYMRLIDERMRDLQRVSMLVDLRDPNGNPRTAQDTNELIGHNIVIKVKTKPSKNPDFPIDRDVKGRYKSSDWPKYSSMNSYPSINPQPTNAPPSGYGFGQDRGGNIPTQLPSNNPPEVFPDPPANAPHPSVTGTGIDGNSGSAMNNSMGNGNNAPYVEDDVPF